MVDKNNVRYHHIRILELIEDEGIYTHQQILEELLQWLPADDIKDFFKTAFGNEGLEPEDEDEDEDEEDEEE